MVDLLDEIKDDIKDEKVFYLIKKYSNLVFSLMAVLILGIALKMWWVSYEENKIHQEGSEFMMAFKKMQANDVENAVKGFETLGREGSSNYAALAKLFLSAHFVSKNDTAKAAALYEELANSNKGKAIKDFAFISGMNFALDDQQPDFGQLISKLENYIKKGGIFKYSAEELLAITQAAKKDLKDAGRTIEKIESAEDAPATIKLRAGQLSKVIN